MKIKTQYAKIGEMKQNQCGGKFMPLNINIGNDQRS